MDMSLVQVRKKRVPNGYRVERDRLYMQNRWNYQNRLADTIK